MLRMTICATLAVALGSCSTTGVTPSLAKDNPRTITIDLKNHPDLSFRIDNFSVPDAARAELEGAGREVPEIFRS